MLVRGLTGLAVVVSGASAAFSTRASATQNSPPAAIERSTADGYRVTFTTINRNSKQPGNSVTQNIVMQVANGLARIDYSGAGVANLPAGAYTVYDAATSRMTMVLPTERQFVPMDSTGVGPTLGQARSMLNMVFTDVTATKDTLGVGELVLGYATRKFRVTMGFTAQINIEGTKFSLRTETESETQLSSEVSLLDPGFRMYGLSAQKTMGTDALFNGDTAMLRTAAIAAIPDAGFPMTQTTTTRIISAADTSTIESTMRVTAFTKTAIDRTTFEVPIGFTATDIGAMARKRVAEQPEPPAARR